MVLSTQHTQSLSDFRQKTTETLNRLKKTGRAEVLTVNGEARAVLLSPAAYDELAHEVELLRDVAVIRRAVQELDGGQGQEAGAFFESLRKQLGARKTSRTKGKGK